MKNNFTNINIYGSSTSLYIRPTKKENTDKTYFELLRDNFNFLEVRNMSLPSGEIKKILKDFDRMFLRFYPNVVILNFGINECVPRVLPRFLFDFVHKKNLASSVFVGFVKSGLNIIINRIIGPVLLKLLFGYGWYSENSFRYYYSKLLNNIKKECGSHIVCITIPPTNLRIKRMLPFVDRKIKKFNNIIVDLAENNGCDIVELTNDWDSNISKYIPEGIHYSVDGHRYIYNKIVDLLELKSDL